MSHLQDVRILVREQGRQRQFADSGEQPDGEEFLARDLGDLGEFLAGDAGGQRMAPEALVVERGALAAAVVTITDSPMTRSRTRNEPSATVARCSETMGRERPKAAALAK